MSFVPYKFYILIFQIVLGLVKFFVVVFGGLLIGVIIGLISSFLTKYTNSVKGNNFSICL